MRLLSEVAKLGPVFVDPGCPSLVTVDFEMGLWNAVGTVLPEAQVILPNACLINKIAYILLSLTCINQSFPFLKRSGCNFHWDKCIDRFLSKHGLSNMRRDVPAFAYAVKLVLALPFLPPAEVRSGYDLIVAHLDAHNAVSEILNLFPLTH